MGDSSTEAQAVLNELYQHTRGGAAPPPPSAAPRPAALAFQTSTKAGGRESRLEGCLLRASPRVTAADDDGD